MITETEEELEENESEISNQIDKIIQVTDKTFIPTEILASELLKHGPT